MRYYLIISLTIYLFSHSLYLFNLFINALTILYYELTVYLNISIANVSRCNYLIPYQQFVYLL